MNSWLAYNDFQYASTASASCCVIRNGALRVAVLFALAVALLAHRYRFDDVASSLNLHDGMMRGSRRVQRD